MALDFIRREDMGGSGLPALHGHVKVTLHNCRTGKNEVAEGDNIVTNAVRDIFAANYLGSLNYGSMLPLWEKWYGGIVCYENQHTLNADNYFMQCEDDNPVTAHAGNVAPSTAEIIQQDLKRGSPLQVTHTDNSVTQTWEWGSEQGNGKISALSLCHVDVGNAGTGSASSAFASLNPLAAIDNLGAIDRGTYFGSPESLFAQYDDYRGLWFHIAKAEQYSYGNTLKTAGTTWITVILHRMPYAKVGLHGTTAALSDAQTFEIETSVTFYNQPSYYFDYDNKLLWLFSNIKSGGRSHDPEFMNYSVIDLSDLSNITETDHGTIENLTDDFAPTCMEQTASSYNPSVSRNANINKMGDYFYFPTSNNVTWSGANYVEDYFRINGFKKINFTNQADQESVVFSGSVQSQLRPYMGSGGFLLGSGYVCNGLVGYPCATSYSDAGWNASPGAISWATHAFNEPQKASSYFCAIGGCSGRSSEDRVIYASKFLNTTLYNLNDSFTKNTSKSMQVEYTLTEV